MRGAPTREMPSELGEWSSLKPPCRAGEDRAMSAAPLYAFRGDGDARPPRPESQAQDAGPALSRQTTRACKAEQLQ